MSTTYPQRFTISTPDGDGEAVKENQGEAWDITLPEGGLHFYGSSVAARAKVREWIDEARTGPVTFGPVEKMKEEA